MPKKVFGAKAPVSAGTGQSAAPPKPAPAAGERNRRTGDPWMQGRPPKGRWIPERLDWLERRR